MTLIVIWLLFGIVSAVVASGRGGNGCLYFGLGVLLGPFGLILAFVVKPPRRVEHHVHQAPYVPLRVDHWDAREFAVPPPSQSRSSAAEIADAIEHLVNLRERGVITEEEFQRAKARLIHG